MSLLIQASAAAKDLTIATVIFASAGEAAATYAGAVAGGSSRRHKVRTAAVSVITAVLARNRGNAPTADRRTRELIVIGMTVAIAAAWLIAADDSATRTGANSWPTLVIGMSIVAAGVLLRLWGVRTLGRFFQRQIVVEPGQALIRRGPYRRLRHPAYAGNLLSIFGFGLMIGSWVGALVGALIALLAHLPRIRVEERTLQHAFGGAYVDYAVTTARLVPGVW